MATPIEDIRRGEPSGSRGVRPHRLGPYETRYDIRRGYQQPLDRGPVTSPPTPRSMAAPAEEVK